MHVIGEDRSPRLDVIPAQYQVIVTHRPKYACRTCQGAIVQAPARLIEGGLLTEHLVAHVVVAKYADHCPLYHQAQFRARQGIAIDRATLAFWTGYAAAEVKPVWRLMATSCQIQLIKSELTQNSRCSTVGNTARSRWRSCRGSRLQARRVRRSASAPRQRSVPG